MAVFEYQGFDGGGKAVKGLIDAETPKVARAKLRKQGFYPTDIHEQSAKSAGKRGSGLNVEIDLSKYLQRVSIQDVSTMTTQMATLSGAGIPMVEALTALLDQVENDKLRVVLADVRDKVNEGTTLADALSGHPKVFDDLYINMVRAGETSGALDTVLIRLQEHMESQVRLRGKLTSAMIYPVLMSVVGSGIVVGLFVFVIPKMRKIFDSFDAELPFFTRALLGISDFAAQWWYLFPPVILLAVWGFRRWMKTPTGRVKLDGWMLKVPIFGKINRLVAVARFCRTLSTLLAAGVPILSAMAIVSRVVQNKVIEKAVEDAAKNVTEGQSLALPLKQSGQFPPIVTHMINIGEKTGELEGMLGKVADAYEQEVDNMVTGLTSLLEPLLILVMGGIVAFVALAILLPMLNMSSLT